MKLTRPIFITMARTSFFLFPVLFLIYQAEFTVEQDASPGEQEQNKPANNDVEAEKEKSASEGSDIDTFIRETAPAFTFAVWDEKDKKICILAKFAAKFTITYESLGGEQTLSINIRPEEKQINVKGHCGTAKQKPLLELSWLGFRLSMIFNTTKSKGEAVPDAWELKTMELVYDTRNALFDGAIHGEKKNSTKLRRLSTVPYPVRQILLLPVSGRNTYV